MAAGSGNAPDSLNGYLLDIDYSLPLSALDAEDQAFILDPDTGIPGTTGFDCESGFILTDSPSSSAAGTVAIETNGLCDFLPSMTPVTEVFGEGLELLVEPGAHSFTYNRLTENTAVVTLTLELDSGVFGVFSVEVEFDEAGNVTILSQTDPQNIGVQLKDIQAEAPTT
jgi:hypothetical protein